VRVVVSGSRDWGHDWVVKRALYSTWGLCQAMEAKMTLVHGGCPSGADKAADTWFWLNKEPGLDMHVFTADWKADGRAAGPLRNIRMFDDPVDLVLAFWNGSSRGTKHVIDLAAARNVPILVRIS
jgi:YspA, cpYpsA-related SLOG family